MLKLIKHKQLDISLAVFFVLFVLNCPKCFSDTILPKLDASSSIIPNEWTLNNLKASNGFWLMNNAHSTVETTFFYDFSNYTEISITAKMGTYSSSINCTTRLEISDDGINWILLKEISFEKANSSGSNFTHTIQYPTNKHTKIRIIAANPDNESGARLYNLELTGTPKFISIPTINETSNITKNSFTANWNKCNNATNYEINVYNKLPGISEKTLLNEDFKEQNNYDVNVENELSLYLPKWKGKFVYFRINYANNEKHVKVGKADTKGGYIQTAPMNLSNNNGDFDLSFDIGTENASSCNVNLYINNEKIQTIPVKPSGMLPNQHISYALSGGTDNCIIKFEAATKNLYTFSIDNITITQKQNNVESSIKGYPKIIVDDNTSCVVDELAPNTTYYFTVKATNGNKTTHNSDESCIKTLSGEQVILASNEEKNFNNEIINGDLLINEGAKINGKVTIKGEILYKCKFTNDKWHSFSLPFAPKNIGAYINGKAYSLRANYDYYLKTYQSQKFVDANLANEGYIIKVKPDIDNGELFFFSEKGVTLNEDKSKYAINSGYSHLGNPYMYNVNPKDLVMADKYYRLKNNKFIECNEDIQPFESFIVYKDTKLYRAVSSIYTDPEMNSVDIQDISASNKIKVWQDQGYLFISENQGPISIYSSNGELIINENFEGERQFKLKNGIYLIKSKDKSHKVIIQ